VVNSGHIQDIIEGHNQVMDEYEDWLQEYAEQISDSSMLSEEDGFDSDSTDDANNNKTMHVFSTGASSYPKSEEATYSEMMVASIFESSSCKKQRFYGGYISDTAQNWNRFTLNEQTPGKNFPDADLFKMTVETLLGSPNDLFLYESVTGFSVSRQHLGDEASQGLLQWFARLSTDIDICRKFVMSRAMSTRSCPSSALELSIKSAIVDLLSSIDSELGSLDADVLSKTGNIFQREGRGVMRFERTLLSLYCRCRSWVPLFEAVRRILALVPSKGEDLFRTSVSLPEPRSLAEFTTAKLAPHAKWSEVLYALTYCEQWWSGIHFPDSAFFSVATSSRCLENIGNTFNKSPVKRQEPPSEPLRSHLTLSLSNPYQCDHLYRFNSLFNSRLQLSMSTAYEEEIITSLLKSQSPRKQSSFMADKVLLAALLAIIPLSMSSMLISAIQARDDIAIVEKVPTPTLNSHKVMR
jgi:hypothetical protein